MGCNNTTQLWACFEAMEAGYIYIYIYIMSYYSCVLLIKVAISIGGGGVINPPTYHYL